MNKYKNGYREGVVFLFFKEGKILMEDRGQGFCNEAFFPNGSIEIKDTLNGDKNYIQTALYREIGEEFNGNIEICNEIFLGELVVDEIKVLFYLFLIINWEGQFPDYIEEPGEPKSLIKFFSVERAYEIVKYESAKIILDKIMTYIKENGY